MTIDAKLSAYLSSLQARGLSEGTIRRRKGTLARFLRHLAEKGISEPSAVTREHVDTYLLFLTQEYRTAQGTPISVHHLRSYHESLKGFFGWLEKKGTILQSPYGLRTLPPLPWPPPLPEVLTPEETFQVLEAVKPNTAMGLRDRSILELLYSTGMRRRELVKLNSCDFSFERAELLIVNPKGKRDRLVPVGEAARQFTEAYRRLVRPWMVCSRQEKALFVSHRGGGRLSLRSVSKIVQKAAQASGVTKRISPHSFRHAMATHLLRNQADLRHIQAILGHAQITSTELYTHLALEDLKEVIRRSHPHGKSKKKLE